MNKKIIIIGGGAAGFFSAINIAENSAGCEVAILEKGNKLLSKVKVSGGGRCNITNVISDPVELSKYYPRGSKELISAFHMFSSNDTIRWFEERGVKLKVENDGRIFPVTDDSQTIIDCLVSSASDAGVKVEMNCSVKNIIPSENGSWIIQTNKSDFYADIVLIASGSNEQVWNLLKKIGHKIEDPFPSLFTFNIKDDRIKSLAGISVINVELKIENSSLKTKGALLITHWGLSGPAILKLSAWGAREFFDKNYNFNLILNWVNKNPEQVRLFLEDYKKLNPGKVISAKSLYNLPSRLWEKLVEASGINSGNRWNEISKPLINNLANELAAGKFHVNGKSTFKEEFVTCGGVNLKEVDFKTMQSKIHKGLFFAGEVLDIDALTGGFNFQAAWTSAWIGAKAINKFN